MFKAGMYLRGDLIYCPHLADRETEAQRGRVNDFETLSSVFFQGKPQPGSQSYLTLCVKESFCLVFRENTKGRTLFKPPLMLKLEWTLVREMRIILFLKQLNPRTLRLY